MNRGRKMKKRILSLLLVMVFVLAGCQSSSDKSEDKTTLSMVRQRGHIQSYLKMPLFQF